HGIFRDIPVLYEWDQRQNRVYDLGVDSVTDVSGRSWSYKVLDNGVYKEIKIGDPNQTLSGRQSYVIAYTVKGALNGFSDHDELYWNVTGNQWAVPIKEASATVTVPAGALLWTHCCCCSWAWSGSVAWCGDVAVIWSTPPLTTRRKIRPSASGRCFARKPSCRSTVRRTTCARLSWA